MPHNEQFLAAIRTTPEDDLPRLVYADWLDENGQPERAEFIRVQCELAKLWEDDPTRSALQKRSDELEQAHRREWAGPLQDNYADSITFHRGFVDRVDLTLREEQEGYIDPLEATVSQNTITELRLAAYPVHSQLGQLFSRMVRWKSLRSLRGLNVFKEPNPWVPSGQQAAPPPSLEHVVRNPYLDKLTALHTSLQVTADELTSFGSASFAGALNRFSVGVAGDRGDWCRTWVRLPFTHQLVEANFAADSHTDDELEVLLTADLQRVTELRIHCNQLTDRTFTQLARWPNCRQLRKLDLTENEFGPNQLSHLIGLPADRLCELRIGGSFRTPLELSEVEWRRFAESALADRLSSLTLHKIGGSGRVTRSLNRGTFRDLRELSLLWVPIWPVDFRELVSASWFSRLQKLFVIGEDMTDAHAAELLNSPAQGQTILDLWSNQFSDSTKQKLRDRFGDRVRFSSRNE